jgi:hypothetical protein
MAIVINDGKDQPTKLKYTGYPKRDGEEPQVRPVGPIIRPPPPQPPGRVLYGFEVLYPVNAACPYKAIQYVKSTVKCTVYNPARGDETITSEYPPADPTATPATPGGFAAGTYANDGPPGGPNVADRISSTDGTDNGFYDSPGLQFTGNQGQHPPATYDAAFLIVIIDCHNNVVDALSFEIHIAVDAAGKVVKNERTSESKPKFTADQPIDKSGLPVK